jgi:hypothetical protein
MPTPVGWAKAMMPSLFSAIAGAVSVPAPGPMPNAPPSRSSRRTAPRPETPPVAEASPSPRPLRDMRGATAALPPSANTASSNCVPR